MSDAVPSRAARIGAALIPGPQILVSILYALLHAFATLQALGRLAMRHEEWSGGDFPTLYATAKAAYVYGMSPYWPEAVRAATGISNVYTTTYPPIAILLFAPYTVFDITTAFFIHTAINFFAAVAFFWLVQKLFLARIGSRYLTVAIIGLLFWESISDQNILVGQTNIIIAALLLLAWHSGASREREIVTGVALGMATLLKVYFAPMLLPFLLSRRLQPVIVAAAVVGVATLLALVLFPMQGWSDWFHIVLPAGRLGQNLPGEIFAGSTHNHSLNGLLTRNVADPQLINLIGYPIIFLISAATAVALWRWRREGKPSFLDRAFPVLLIALFLISPLSWVTNYVYLWIALLSIIAGAESAARNRVLGTIAFGLLIMFCLPWQKFIFGPYEKLFGIPATCGALLAWLIALGWAMQKQRGPMLNAVKR